MPKPKKKRMGKGEAGKKAQKGFWKGKPVRGKGKAKKR